MLKGKVSNMGELHILIPVRPESGRVGRSRKGSVVWGRGA